MNWQVDEVRRRPYKNLETKVKSENLKSQRSKTMSSTLDPNEAPRMENVKALQ